MYFGPQPKWGKVKVSLRRGTRKVRIPYKGMLFERLKIKPIKKAIAEAPPQSAFVFVCVVFGWDYFPNVFRSLA